MGKSYKHLYAEEVNKNKEIIQLREQLVEETKKSVEQKEKDNTKISKLENDREILTTKQTELEASLQENRDLLRINELSRFASAYEKQELNYGDQQKFWFKLCLYSTGLLTISILLTTFGPTFLHSNITWYKEPGLYLLNIVFLTLFVYTLKQHSHLGNLKIDYGNRKTLAQSYQHIIEDEGHEEIQEGFLKNAADIFSSKAMMNNGDVTIYEAIVTKILGLKKSN